MAITEKEKIWRKQNRIKNKEKIKEQKRNSYLRNKEYVLSKAKEYYLKNKNKKLEYQRKYKKENYTRISEYQKNYTKQRRKTDIQYRLSNDLRRRILLALQKKDLKKTQKTIDLIGCSLYQLIEHLEKQFKEGMTWENRGFNGWHIDHIIPISSFDLNDIEQQKACFHYTNLQPLWAKENLLKSNKF